MKIHGIKSPSKKIPQINMTSLEKKIRKHITDRNWEKFHSPKNLAMALTIEASELSEEFLWLTESESLRLKTNQLSKVKDELGDVFLILLELASRLKIDLFDAADQKLVKNATKYPVAKSKGNAKKYTEFT